MLRKIILVAAVLMPIPVGFPQTVGAPTTSSPVTAAYIEGPMATVPEGRPARFKVRIEGPRGPTVRVRFVTESGTAGALDFRHVVRDLVFPVGGEWETYVDVDTFVDAQAEGLEHFTARLSNPVDTGIAVGTAYGTISDGAPFLPTPGAPGAAPATKDTVGITGDYIAVENGIDHIRLQFVRLSLDPQRLRIDFFVDPAIFAELLPTGGWTNLMRGYIDFEAGELVKTVELQAVRDGVPEGIERFTLTLQPSDRYRIASPADKLIMPLPGHPLASGGTPIGGDAMLSILDGTVLFGNEYQNGQVKVTDSQVEDLLHPNDIRQTTLENCGLWAGVMISLAKTGSARMAAMMSELPGGGYLVSFKDGTSYTVAADLFTSPGGPTDDFREGLSEVWPIVLEKALQQRFGRLCPQTPEVVRVLTRMGSRRLSPPYADIPLNVDRLYLATKPAPPGSRDILSNVKLYQYPRFDALSFNRVAYQHAHVIGGYRVDANGEPWIFLRNPWGFSKSGWLPLRDLADIAAEVLLFGDGLPFEGTQSQPIMIDVPGPP